MFGFVLKKLIKGITPYGIVECSKFLRRDYKFSDLYLRYRAHDLLAILDKNKIFKNKHKNKRCFILGTGPSINKIDMNKLKNDKCIFLSQFYLHNSYKYVNSEYHLFSGMSPHFSGKGSSEPWINFFKQIEQQISTSTNLFMNYLDRDFIIENNFFTNHNVYYLYFKKSLNSPFAGKIDASKALYEAGGVPVMAIQLAIYMGFSEIYLLGIDCTWDSGTSNNHCYNHNDSVVDHLGYSREDIMANLSYIEREYRQFLGFLDQLRALDGFAKRAGCKIYNAAPGGKLDVFERIDFNSLF